LAATERNTSVVPPWMVYEGEITTACASSDSNNDDDDGSGS
jgi:hypothetical protein